MPPPPLRQKSVFAVRDASGILGHSLVQETITTNQRLRQQHRHVEHDYYVEELPKAVSREKDAAAEAIRRRIAATAVVDISRRQRNNNISVAAAATTSPSPIAKFRGAAAAELDVTTTSPLARTNPNRRHVSLPQLRDDDEHTDDRGDEKADGEMGIPIVRPKSGNSYSWVFHGDAGRRTPFDLTSSNNGKDNNNDASALKAASGGLPAADSMACASQSRRNLLSSMMLTSSSSQRLPVTSSAVNNHNQNAARSRSRLTAGASTPLPPPETASDALVRQLDLLRMRAPTPTMSDDVAHAFSKYVAPHNRRHNNLDVTNNSTNISATDADQGFFSRTQCVVATSGTVLGSPHRSPSRGGAFSVSAANDALQEFERQNTTATSGAGQGQMIIMGAAMYRSRSNTSNVFSASRPPCDVSESNLMENPNDELCQKLRVGIARGAAAQSLLLGRVSSSSSAKSLNALPLRFVQL